MKRATAIGATAVLAVLLTGAAPTPVPQPDPGAELRRAVYADVFSGGDGLAHPIDAVAEHVAPLRALLASRPAGVPAPELLGRVLPGPVLPGPDLPAPELIGPDLLGTAATGTRTLRSAGSLLVHAPAGEPFALDTDALPGEALRGWWFDPRTGTPIDLGTVLRGADVPFFPPVTGPADAGRDWVLVIDSLPLVPPGGA